jgi:hypothetical protein
MPAFEAQVAGNSCRRRRRWRQSPPSTASTRGERRRPQRAEPHDTGRGCLAHRLPLRRRLVLVMSGHRRWLPAVFPPVGVFVRACGSSERSVLLGYTTQCGR